MALYFYEDEVFRVTKKGQVEFGVVLRNSESTDTDSESDLEEPQRLRPGQVLVSWHPSSREQVVAEKKIGLTDRCLMLGDIVRRLAPGEDTQCGYCRNVSMSSVVQVCGTSRVIYEVSSQRLTPLEEFVADIAVCLDSWVGMINSVNSEVTVEFADRSLCVLSGTQVIELDEVDGWRKPDSEAWYYPGQKLQGTMRKFQSARWLRCNRETEAMKQRKNKTVKVTVTDYRVVSLHVHWQCSAGCGEDSKAPPVFISGDQLSRLRMLNVLEPCTLQLGDINTCRLRAEDVVMSLDQWKWLEKDTMKQLLASKEHQPTAATSAPPAASSVADATGSSAAGLLIPSEDAVSVSSYNSATADSTAVQHSVRRAPRLKTVNMKKRKLKRSRRSQHHDVLEVRPEPNIGDKLVVETLKTQSTVTVVWQDGTVEEDIPSVELYPMHHLDEHEFFPGDFVREQKTGVNSGVCDYGVVQRVDHRDRTAVVDWYRDQPSARPELLRRDEVSVYDISDHADYRYRPGTVVLNTDVRTEPQCSNQPPSTDVRTEPPCSNQPSSRDVRSEPPCSSQPPSTEVRTESPCTSTGFEAAHRVQSHTQQRDSGSPPLPTSEQSAGAPTVQHVRVAETPASAEGAEAATASAEGAEAATASAEGAEAATGSVEGAEAATGSAEGAEAATVGTTKAFAGQVLDVLTTGMVKVWWTDETISECYPQSLIRVGEYDSDEGELWDNNADSSDSTEWETESEESVHIGGATAAAPETPADEGESVSCEMRLGDSAGTPCAGKLEEADQISLGKRLLLNITQTHSALVRTQDILDQRAALQSPAVLKQLVSIYQDCRCLDKLLDTNFFDESHFSGFVSELQENSRVVADGDDEHVESRTHADSGASGGVQGNQPKHPRLNGYCEIGFEKASVFCGQIHNQLYSAYVQVKSRCPWAGDDGLGDLLKKSSGCHSSSPSSPQPSHHTDMTSHASPISPSKGAISCGSHHWSGFTVLSSDPDGHVYQKTVFKPADPSGFLRAVKREMKMLASSLPDGILVRGYEQRMDLYSVMICGPPRTPYADGLFFFDVQLDSEYPRTPPTLHYHSYCRDRINPNLYEDGKVCVSLLGTWGGRGTEVWAPSSSTLLQVLVSIQGLILVSEPYYNEAGYDKQRGTQQAGENSRLYNEMVLVKLVQSLTTIAERPPVVFAEEVSQHLRSHASRLIERLRGWLRFSESSTSESDSIRPDFPLLPVSRGFRITLNKSISHLVQTLERCGVLVGLDSADLEISNS